MVLLTKFKIVEVVNKNKDQVYYSRVIDLDTLNSGENFPTPTTIARTPPSFSTDL